MNVFAKFDEIPSMILQDVKETKRNGHTLSEGRKQYTHPQTQFARGGGGIIKTKMKDKTTYLQTHTMAYEILKIMHI